MRKLLYTLCLISALSGCLQPSTPVTVPPALPSNYLIAFVTAARTPWPRNRPLNIVFHGHSVPAGFFRTPEVRTLEAYPHLTLQGLTARYPYAQINVIVSAKGGENSIEGEGRFARDVITHRPDIVVIDYVLNDKDLPIDQTNQAWRSMIRQAKTSGATVLLVTATPDLSASATAIARLAQHSQQVREIASSMGVGLVDVESVFKTVATNQLSLYMAQANHPNGDGHGLIAKQILAWFP